MISCVEWKDEFGQTWVNVRDTYAQAIAYAVFLRNLGYKPIVWSMESA